jgi:drug/metabolite transporter (DMT)-like permease
MPVPLNALFALAAAASWGGGDFSGGVAVKAAGGTTTSALRVVIVAHALSLTVLLTALAITGGVWPHGAPLVWSLLTGIAASVSLTAFYIAMSRGEMGPAAAVSGLLATAIPAIVSSIIEGQPGTWHLAGFALAAAAIWLIAAGPSPENSDASASRAHNRTTMALAIFSGLGFGFYLTAMRMANSLGVIEPMAIARCVSLILCSLLLWLLTRSSRAQASIPLPGSRSLPRAALLGAIAVALLDTGGNMLFIAATRAGRLDVAAVLSSLYPAATILLAAWYLHERPTRRQWSGMAVALAAVILLTL